MNLVTAGTSRAKATANDTCYDAVDSYIMEQMRRYHIPGVSLAIVEGEKIAHLRSFGRARPSGEAPTPQTPFFIGSLTKSFTALAVMQLVEAGKIELDAPVQRTLPWFRVADPLASAQITVRHLLNQTSGLPQSRGLADLGILDCQPDATERQVRALSNVKLGHPAGSKFAYDNTNYNILGLIIEAASGETYAEYIQQHIFNPLDMRHSYTAKDEAQQDGLAVGYRYWFGHPFPATSLSSPCGSLPSGQLISNAEDMAHYLIANLNGGRYGGTQILSEAGIAEMQHGVAEIRESGLSLGFYGMGWISQEKDGFTTVSHSGIVPDFGAVMALLPEQRKGIVLLFNVNHAMMKLTFDELGMGAAQLLAGKAPTRSILRAAPWAMRGLLLIPFLQLASLFFSLKHFSHRRPYSLLPVTVNLLAAATLLPLLGQLRGFIKLFMPDYVWTALLSSSIAAIWAFLQAVLLLQVHRKNDSENHKWSSAADGN